MKKFTRYSSSEKVTLCKKEGNKYLRERFTFLELEILSFFLSPLLFPYCLKRCITKNWTEEK